MKVQESGGGMENLRFFRRRNREGLGNNPRSQLYTGK